METILIISLIILVLGIVGMFIFKDDSSYASAATAIVYSMIILITATIEDEPSAMDVYKGKTELKYTVVGNEKVDSVVVFKYEKDSK